MSDFISMIRLVKKPTNRNMKRQTKDEVEKIVNRIHNLEVEYWERVIEIQDTDQDHHALFQEYSEYFDLLLAWIKRNIRPRFIEVNEKYFSMYYGVEGRS
jgi:tRNA uridine 5-carbamoylmethylation protein Kti12